MKLVPLDLRNVEWERLDAFADRVLFQTRPWLSFVARTHDMASALVLSVIPGYHVGPRRLPPCPSLRGMPCRPFVAVHNQPG